MIVSTGTCLPRSIDRVAVVGQDRVDERLADVVHVAEHGRDHDLALGVALDPLEVVLELGDGALHHLGRLEHERQDQLAGAELVADLLHRRQQHLVERRDGADLLDRACRSSPRRRPSCGAGCASGAPPRAPCPRSGRRPSSSSSSPFDSKCSMKRSSASSRRLKTRSSASSRSSSEISRVGRDVVRVDHREVEPGLDAVVEEDRVEHRARGLARRRRRRSRRRARS